MQLSNPKITRANNIKSLKVGIYLFLSTFAKITINRGK